MGWQTNLVKARHWDSMKAMLTAMQIRMPKDSRMHWDSRMVTPKAKPTMMPKG